ncbi:MAG: sigma-70 family RNA polymerase sigma factor [Armatimonadia bacterium]|nr:sigma-70 family RNA polymerase sigma factor [Armatimonadia bacterium]
MRNGATADLQRGSRIGLGARTLVPGGSTGEASVASTQRQPDYGTIDSAALVARAVGGDTFAFERLIEIHADTVAAVVTGLLGPSHDDVADATQETFLRAYERLHQCREPRKVGAWLARIARNVCRDRRRGGWWRRVTLAAKVPEPRCAGPEDADIADIWSALMTLPDDRRLLLILRYYYGYSLAQVGELTGLQPEAVRSRVRRALGQMRKLLGPGWEADHD